MEPDAIKPPSARQPPGSDASALLQHRTTTTDPEPPKTEPSVLPGTTDGFGGDDTDPQSPSADRQREPTTWGAPEAGKDASVVSLPNGKAIRSKTGSDKALLAVPGTSNDSFMPIGPSTMEGSPMSKSTSGRELFPVIRELFPDHGGAAQVQHYTFFTATVVSISTAVLVLFSGVAGIGYKTYAFCMLGTKVWMLWAGTAFSLALILHIFDWYRWPLKLIMGPAVLVVYLMFAAMVSHAKRYPGAPLIVASLHAPIALGICRFVTRREVSSQAYHKAVAFICLLTGVAVMAAWLAWLFIEDMTWGSNTKDALQERLHEVHAIYGVSDWTQCQTARSDKRSIETENEELLEFLQYCSRIELTAYLIWSCPAGEAIVLMAMAMFCGLRLWMYEKGGVERVLKHTMFMLCFFVTVFWVSASVAGSSMGLANVLLAGLGFWGFAFVVWLVLAVDIADVLQKASGTVIFKLARPLLQSDAFAGLMFCFTQIMIIMFIFLEIFVRYVQRCLGMSGSHDWITDRGFTVIRKLRKYHFVSVSEMSFWWCILYMMTFLCTKFTPVFLGFLGDWLQAMPFEGVMGAFYVTGLVMFLLPPVPGVPVYIAAGWLICVRGKEEPWYTFPRALLLAIACSLVLKLHAVAMQQKMIGEAFGRYLYIQQLVGVHTTTIRALEKILRKPGLGLSKVVILIGGPDWPTSVLTGILKMSLFQMLLGTLPVICIQVPCVLAGASLTEDSLKEMSALIVMMVAVSQGGMMLLAAVFIAQEADVHYQELSVPLPEHEAILEKERLVEERRTQYREKTAWRRLGHLHKFLLIAALSCEFAACWASFFLGSACFRQFEIGTDVNAGYADGGLRGDALNLVTYPLGWMVIGSTGVGLVFFGLYKMTVSSCLTETIVSTTES
eukprot:TRINITY_DN101208_c0_g1_i1.p1 TRINITY_DN101208_c0_g1~~TRINITY_DN101208_c0_g1_i1.p1  ORF type:complete len:896 (+),score=172.51 TRINITY_DN101208_c0_g1_i1:225-2912(+)